ncbi:unnamed protein product [Owenia fusiformis]|uniref:Uncharacterized protein n=1 Tax=Owenia fusiformis TaxID=6347 RepID=A0A8J1U1J5_OWEFU|nr:unnamed protein product [Owenia fusiformis]
MFLKYIGRCFSSESGMATKGVHWIKSIYNGERNISQYSYGANIDHHRCAQSKRNFESKYNYSSMYAMGTLHMNPHRKYSSTNITSLRVDARHNTCGLLKRNLYQFGVNIIGTQRLYSTMLKHSVSLDELLRAHIDQLSAEYEELNKMLLECGSDDRELAAAQVSKRLAELGPVMYKVAEYNAALQERQELKNILKNELDKELIAMVNEELEDNQTRTTELQDKLLHQLVPRLDGDEVDEVILEVSAGVGGQEAMLFTEEMFRLYEAYAQNSGWLFQSIGQSTSDIGGMKKASASISGSGVYREMKYECGVHRVQRVPRTEKAGRVHTSTMTVAILPRPTQIDVVLRPQDIHFEAFRASGAGGQHVNTTSSAVRVKHIPTGTVVERSTDRSQIVNRKRAMEELASRIYSAQLEREMAARKSQRKLQVGTAGRSEKIRTYNIPQDRVTDHRIGVSLYDLNDFMNGGRGLGELIEALLKFEWEESVTEFLQKQTIKST